MPRHRTERPSVPLMILLQVNLDGVLAVPFERDAPGPIDVDSVADRLAPQSVKIEARHIQGPWMRGRIQRVQPRERAIREVPPNSRSVVPVPKGGERPASERPSCRPPECQLMVDTPIVVTKMAI